MIEPVLTPITPFGSLQPIKNTDPNKQQDRGFERRKAKISGNSHIDDIIEAALPTSRGTFYFDRLLVSLTGTDLRAD